VSNYLFAYLQMSLEAAGYEVVLAKNGEQALQLFQKENPDLLIVDVMLPKANGFQICRKVKTNIATQATPVILLTAKRHDEDVYWGTDCGADEYLTKPFSTKELEQTIGHLIKRRREQAPSGDAGVADEHKRRQEKGEPSTIVWLDWDPRVMDVYRRSTASSSIPRRRAPCAARSRNSSRKRKTAGRSPSTTPRGCRSSCAARRTRR
jgi:DNA-binding response OmpR family regulator